MLITGKRFWTWVSLGFFSLFVKTTPGDFAQGANGPGELSLPTLKSETGMNQPDQIKKGSKINPNYTRYKKHSVAKKGAKVVKPQAHVKGNKH